MGCNRRAAERQGILFGYTVSPHVVSVLYVVSMSHIPERQHGKCAVCTRLHFLSIGKVAERRTCLPLDHPEAGQVVMFHKEKRVWMANAHRRDGELF